ncbi:Uncharacterised protein [[Actinobacillus] rossii]|uniref:Uncharacterized protein n=1 Tax=[Actinobacillus] rossii TaxID=123820 RepID=A0A380U1J8_9PAST|nr:Uncharacterised protein [[Actinobacillus] rossii]
MAVIYLLLALLLLSMIAKVWGLVYFFSVSVGLKTDEQKRI